MAAARKRELEEEALIEPAAEAVSPVGSQLLPTTIARTSPFRSPARDMQESLAERLREPTPPKNNVASGLIVGVIGATWVTGMLIYATL